jgi:hypothetical protein
MNSWQLPGTLLWRQVEVLAVPCSGYTMQVIAGSAPMVQRRGAKLAGCRFAPKPPYGTMVNRQI